MTDFFKMMESDLFAELATAQATAAKPTSEMTPAEWAEYQVLDALMKLEALRADVIYARVTGRHPNHE